MMTTTNSIPLEMSPAKFFAFIDLAQKVDEATYLQLESFSADLDICCQRLDEEVDSLASANNALLAEVRQMTRRKNPFSDTEEKDPFSDLRHTVEGQNFLRVIFDVVAVIQRGHRLIAATARNVRPAEFQLMKGATGKLESMDDIQRTVFEMQLNQGALNRFLDGLMSTESVKNMVIGLGKVLNDHLDEYHRTLTQRHSTKGIKIHCDPVTTDVAMSIFENVDAHGEIMDGKKPNEISAYSVRKATIVADAVQHGLIGEFIRKPEKLITFVIDNLNALWAMASELKGLFAETVEKARDIYGYGLPPVKELGEMRFRTACVLLKDLDPRNIVYKEKVGLQTPEERFALNFRNETLQEITHRLTEDRSVDDLIQYILQRKAQLRDYYMDENSFYVCKMGGGNAFTGEAPGALTVVPGTRPVVNLDEIIGSGFAEVKGFMTQIAASSKWHDLFVATSPSRTADKSNVLLVGPMGCGKSEILRAVGGEKKSLGIFAQGSDFLTCWKGEAEKNPKRLFEESLRLQRESKKHVHILIDEIDTILGTATGRDAFGSTNLVTEFQILMDGVIHYPNLSVWGATNHPERISMPMLRRFSKVLIVGELDAPDRIKLLKHFMGFMPLEGFKDSDWVNFAERTEGAVGDILRKMCDHVWREKMTTFVEAQPEKAEQLVSFLNYGGTKFNIAEFTPARKAGLHQLLRIDGVFVRPEDLGRAIEVHLENVAIHAEILEAKRTYADAKAFLANIRKSAVKEKSSHV